MCNKVHKGQQKRIGILGDHRESYDANFRKIDKGRAWKVVLVEGPGEYKAAFTHVHFRRARKNEPNWLTWDKNKLYSPQDGDGFCFFMRKKDAVEMLAVFERDHFVERGHYAICRIEYCEGVGAFYSDESDGKLRRVGIAKRFRIIREVE